ncbi:hypothetical protein [Hymenobacter glaciei]
MNPSPNVFERLAAGQEERAVLVRATVHELQTNPAYQPHFAGYTPDSVAAFIEQYALRKAGYVFDGPQRAKYFEAGSTEVQERAQTQLWSIQQKKLFDLQCRWRAGLFQHPDIHVTDQFDYWGRHPERCPFLPAITPEEVALYLDYLNQPDCPEGDWSRYRRTPLWQDYHHLRSEHYPDELALLPPDSHVFTGSEEAFDDEDEDEEEDKDDFDDDDEEEDEGPAYPSWYRFYDQHHGTGHLRHLHNVRGLREQHYQQLHLADSWRNPPAAPPAPVAPALAAAADTTPAPATETPADSMAEPQSEPMAPEPPQEPVAPVAPYVPETRPWLSLYGEADFRMVMEQIDPTPGLMELRRAQEQGIEDRDNEDAEGALLAFCNLRDSPLVVPIEADAPDWRPALRQAELLLRRQQLARALPHAYDDYCQRQALGLAQNPSPLEHTWDDETTEPWNINYAREQVLHGRELAGEPRDFDY